MPINLSQGNCQYTVITTLGTTTINPGPTGPYTGTPGALYGAYVTSIGTATGTNTAGLAGVTVVDIIPALGTNASSTNTLLSANGTAAGQALLASGSSLGVRYRGALVAITVNTQGTGIGTNILWD